MFIAKNKDLIVLAKDTRKELEKALICINYDTIEETDEDYTLYNGMYVTAEKKAEQERERLDNLSMTRGDVFEALILARGLGKAQIRSMIEQAELDTVTKALYLNRFDEALEFYRGYPIFDMLGEALGITGAMLDRFFETKDYHYLTTCRLTINAVPTEATITGNGSYPYGTLVDYKVELEGYKPYTGSIELLKDTELNIELEKIEEVVDENTTDTTESDVQDEVDTKATDELNAN